MTDPAPSEFVAAHELSRYPPQLVLDLIKAAKEWRDYHVPGLGWRVQTTALVDAVDALTGGES